MVFSSTIFLFLFLPFVLLIYYNPIFKSRKFKNIILMCVSIGFYAWGEPIFVFVMLFSIVFNWFLALKIAGTGEKVKKIFLIISIVYNIGLLFIFKYLSFVVENVSLLLNRDKWSLKIALPIGISFFTFQILSYVLDVYNGKVKVQKNVLKVALYVSLFPQLIAGPIVRYSLIEDEIDHRKESWDSVEKGLFRFVYGLAKKVLMANYMAIIADNVFSMNTRTFVMAWLGAIAYTLQIYFDFSGYSDMAIGLGEIFGFHFEENFKHPYISSSVTEFWKRWHISLSSWFKDYVYIPLGGNRVSRNRWIFNLFIVWLLTGIWHGANWTFLVWGLLYFIFRLLETYIPVIKKLGVFSHIYTMLIVITAWVIFRSESLLQAVRYIGQMFGIGNSRFIDSVAIDYMKNSWLLFGLGVIFSTPAYQTALKKIKNAEVRQACECAVILFLFVLSVLACIKSTYNPFIYFNF